MAKEQRNTAARRGLRSVRSSHALTRFISINLLFVFICPMISDLIWLWSDFDRHCFVNLCAGVCDTMLVMDFGRFVQRPCPPQPPRTTLLVFFRGTGMIWCAIYKINTDTGTILIDIHWLKHDKHWYTRLYIIHTISYILVSDGIYLYNMQIYIY